MRTILDSLLKTALKPVTIGDSRPRKMLIDVMQNADDLKRIFFRSLLVKGTQAKSVVECEVVVLIPQCRGEGRVLHVDILDALTQESRGRSYPVEGPTIREGPIQLTMKKKKQYYLPRFGSRASQYFPTVRGSY
jgi:hypothetical protein